MYLFKICFFLLYENHRLYINVSKNGCNTCISQNKEGILPVATQSIALYLLRRSRSASDVAPEVAI